MQSKIDMLLSILEAEEKNLLDAIEAYIEEQEYKYAQWQKKGLAQVMEKMRVLKSFKDPYTGDMEFLTGRIDTLYRKLSTSTDHSFNEYLITEIQAAEKELETLRQRRSFELDNPPPTVVEQTLAKLIAGEIKGFTIVFDKQRNVTAVLKYARKTLSLRIPSLKQLRRADILNDYKIKRAESMGFTTAKNFSELRLVLKGAPEEVVDAFKITLARVTFELLHQYSYSQSFIVIDM